MYNQLRQIRGPEFPSPVTLPPSNLERVEIPSPSNPGHTFSAPPEQTPCLWMSQDRCTHKLTVAVLACTEPVQHQASRHSGLMERKRFTSPAPLTEELSTADASTGGRVRFSRCDSWPHVIPRQHKHIQHIIYKQMTINNSTSVHRMWCKYYLGVLSTHPTSGCKCCRSMASIKTFNRSLQTDPASIILFMLIIW